MKITATTAPLPPEEIEKRIEEYRRISFERRLSPQVVYQPPFQVCPTPGCNQRIDGIHFQMEKWVQGADLDRFLKAWWCESGLVGRCPGCGNYILFGLTSKIMVSNPNREDVVLPDNWAEKAHLVSKSKAIDRDQNGVA